MCEGGEGCRVRNGGHVDDALGRMRVSCCSGHLAKGTSQEQASHLEHLVVLLDVQHLHLELVHRVVVGFVEHRGCECRPVLIGPTRELLEQRGV